MRKMSVVQKVLMSSDCGSLLSYFSKTELTSESTPRCTDDAPVPESDVGSAGCQAEI